MENIYKTIYALNFYSLANELKTTKINANSKYSIADQIFGSMILAIAMDSEFKESDDLAKINRMIFLSEFSNLYPDYDFEQLELGKQYENELAEAKNINNEYGRLVNNYIILDTLLTKLISEKGNKLSSEELNKEGCTIIASICSKDPAECEEIFRFYQYNFRLKDKERSGWNDTHWNIDPKKRETVSEHIVGTISELLAFNTIFKYNFDIDTALTTLVLHEEGETIVGDITPFDGITEEEKQQLEYKAVKEVLGNLKDKDIYLKLWLEFDNKETTAGRFAYYCDKLEADLQSKIYLEKGLHHPLDNQQNNCVFKSLKIQQMVIDGAKNAFDIWYESDKNKYTNEEFPEFINILNIAKDNNLLQLSKAVKKQVHLSNEEHSSLSQELISTLQELYEDDNIESVYVTNYQDEKTDKGLLKVCILLNNHQNDYKYDRVMKELNSKTAESNKTGISIDYCYDYSNNYITFALNKSEVTRIERLAESTILFDKTGYITKTQERCRELNHYFWFYLVDYIPPIDQDVAKEFKKLL